MEERASRCKGLNHQKSRSAPDSLIDVGGLKLFYFWYESMSSSKILAQQDGLYDGGFIVGSPIVGTMPFFVAAVAACTLMPSSETLNSSRMRLAGGLSKAHRNADLYSAGSLQGSVTSLAESELNL